MTHPIYRVTPPEEKAGTAGDGNLATPMRLRDFLVGVATIYDLPEVRRRKLAARAAAVSAAQAPKAAIEKATVRRGVLKSHALLAAAAVTSLIWAFDAINKPAALAGILPEAINGGWHTKDVRYRNRAFWIKGDRIAFQTGRDSMEVTIHQITQVDQRILGGDTLQYTVQYLVDGEPISWAIQFIQNPKPAIRFVNQRELIWTPAANSSWPTQ